MPIDDKEFENIVTGTQNNYTFRASITRILTEFMMSAVLPWFKYCLSHYTQEQFHQYMKNGFSFVSDWKANHPDKYSTFVSRAKKVKFFIKIDEYDILRRIDYIMAKEGWTLYENEKQTILNDIRALKKDIYGKA